LSDVTHGNGGGSWRLMTNTDKSNLVVAAVPVALSGE